MRWTWMVAGLVGCLVVMAGSALGQTFSPTDDASGSGFDLVEVGDVELNQTTVVDKFGKGVAFDGTDGFVSSDSGLFLTGDMSVSFAGETVTADTGFRVGVSGPVGSGEVAYRVIVGSEAVFWTQRTSGQTGVDTVSCSWSGPEEFVSGWAVRNEVTLLDDEVRIKAFDQNGTVLCDVDVTLGQDGGTSGSDEFNITSSSASRAGGFEVRLWDQQVGEVTLDEVADPTDDAFTQQAVSSELGLWFLEFMDPVGLSDLENTVAVYADQEVGVGESFSFHAEGHNQSGLSIDPEENLTVFITTTDGATTRWLNASTGTLQAFAVPNEMVPVSGLETDTLFQSVISAGFPEPGAYRLEVWMQKAPGGEGEGNDMWVGTFDVVVVEQAIVQAHQTELVELTKLTAFELGWFVAVTVAGVVLWSRSLDPVVRGFGAVLPMIAGALLLSFGADQGFGSVWGGTLALAVVMVLVGVAMLVRQFLEAAKQEMGGVR